MKCGRHCSRETKRIGRAISRRGAPLQRAWARLLNTTAYLVAAGALMAGLAPAPAIAATATTSFTVSATVIGACSISATPLVFGNYNPTGGTNLDATTTLVVLCTTGTSYDVGLDAGGGSGASVTSRKMSFLANTLTYGLYQDAAHTTVWGNTVGSDTVAGTAGLLPTTLTVYGRVPSGQNAPIGVYTDIIQVTLTY